MFHNTADARDFTLAGNAIVTISSLKTGQHYTYQIRRADRGEAWFVALLTGPNNTSDYTYIGMLSGTVEAYPAFVLTRKSRLPESAPPIQAFRYFWQHMVRREEIPEQLEVRHEGRCGRCSRTLTVPESLDRGIGPECAHIMQRVA